MSWGGPELIFKNDWPAAVLVSALFATVIGALMLVRGEADAMIGRILERVGPDKVLAFIYEPVGGVATGCRGAIGGQSANLAIVGGNDERIIRCKLNRVDGGLVNRLVREELGA